MLSTVSECESAMGEYELEDFERIEERFFNRGFATMTKSEAEVHLFDVYMKGLERAGEVPSYYQIGRNLGLTEARVRTLVEKRSLFFQEKPAIADCLLYLMDHAPATLSDSNTVRIQINDVNYLHAIQDYLEAEELAYKPELSGKAFQISVADFFRLVNDSFGEQETSAALSKLYAQIQENEEIGDRAQARSITDIATDPNAYLDLLESLSIGGHLVPFVRQLSKLIKEARASRT